MDSKSFLHKLPAPNEVWFEAFLLGTRLLHPASSFIVHTHSYHRSVEEGRGQCVWSLEGLYYPYYLRVPGFLSSRPNWLIPSPPPLPQASGFPLGTKGCRGAILACGWVGGGIQFGRLEKKPGTLYTLWSEVTKTVRIGLWVINWLTVERGGGGVGDEGESEIEFINC